MKEMQILKNDAWTADFTVDQRRFGMFCWLGGHIRSLRRTAPGHFKARVLDDGVFPVEVSLSEEGRVLSSRCSCAEASENAEGRCCHAAAVLLALKRGRRSGRSEETLDFDREDRERAQLKEDLDRMMVDDMSALLFERAQDSRLLRAEVHCRTNPSASNEAALWRCRLEDQVKRRDSAYWGSERMEENEILRDLIHKAVCQGAMKLAEVSGDLAPEQLGAMLPSPYWSEAFELALSSFETLCRNLLTEELETEQVQCDCCSVMAELLEQANGPLADRMWERLEKLRAELPEQVQQHAVLELEEAVFSDETNVWRMREAADRLVEEAERAEEPDFTESRRCYELVLRLMRAGWEKKADIRAYFRNHHDFAAARVVESEWLMEIGDNLTALELLRECRVLDRENEELMKLDTANLISVMEKLEYGDGELRPELWYLLEHGEQENLDLVHRLKKHTLPKEWKRLRRKVWQLETLEDDPRREFLLEEGMLRELMEDLEQEPELLALHEYEKELLPLYPKRLCRAYLKGLRAFAEGVNAPMAEEKIGWVLNHIAQCCPDGETVARREAERWRQRWPKNETLDRKLKEYRL